MTKLETMVSMSDAIINDIKKGAVRVAKRTAYVASTPIIGQLDGSLRRRIYGENFDNNRYYSIGFAVQEIDSGPSAIVASIVNIGVYSWIGYEISPHTWEIGMSVGIIECLARNFVNCRYMPSLIGYIPSKICNYLYKKYDEMKSKV